MTSLQIRNVPDQLHRRLKARAALEGQSLSEYALEELRRAAERPTRRELIERVARLERSDVSMPAWEAVRAERDSR
ncbi:FitA-like ribbon-helix-helix domain-containing protein [Candidatus Poriferisodalis sp.]|uniref:FitA-like ribbon-helix-helix domain-containing protein n=1 Tax=Candidatus Poriferisodalis sp. TaxID=3101277 RepID=UPI003B026AA3